MNSALGSIISAASPQQQGLNGSGLVYLSRRFRKAMLLAALTLTPSTLIAQTQERTPLPSQLLALPARWWTVSLGLLLSSVVGIAVGYKWHLRQRFRRKADVETRERIRETDDLTDDLLQGVQGLMLTFHVAAQNISEEHASKKLLDHALLEADELLSDGRRRFERVAFRILSSEQVTEDSSSDGPALHNDYLGPGQPGEDH